MASAMSKMLRMRKKPRARTIGMEFVAGAIWVAAGCTLPLHCSSDATGEQGDTAAVACEYWVTCERKSSDYSVWMLNFSMCVSARSRLQKAGYEGVTRFRCRALRCG